MERTAAQTRVVCPIQDIEVRDSSTGDGSYTVKGYAAVFNSLSLDLGGFQEKIDPGAFTNALAKDPDVLGVWDHDTSQTLGRTRNGTLELREDDHGLGFWMRVAPTSYAADLRVLLERGDISQCSFMFTIERERYELMGEGERQIVVFTVEEVGDLYDITICGRGAYPATDVSMAAMHARRFEQARASGRLPEGADVPPANQDEAMERAKAAREAHALAVEQAKRRRADA